MSAAGPSGMDTRLPQRDAEELTAFRRRLHQWPEVSGEEIETARAVVTELEALYPDAILTGLGGHGVAAVFKSGESGPTVMFRAELDALPIPEENDVVWASKVAGKSHVCGHDGHMTMLLGLGRLLSRQPVARGRVVLLFQPSEEDGRGARAVVADPRFAEIKPDWAFAIHVIPGPAFGTVSTRAGLINCASKGLRVTLQGRTAHAAEPDAGLSPAGAMATLIPALNALSVGNEHDDRFRLVTLTHLRMGEPTFGIAPGEGEIFLTLRTGSDAHLAALEEDVRRLVDEAAHDTGLSVAYSMADAFAASINDPQAYAVAVAAMKPLGLVHSGDGVPMRASEDFGVFGQDAKAAMLCLGAGPEMPALHNPDYDFPDGLIPIGSALFARIARDLLGTGTA